MIMPKLFDEFDLDPQKVDRINLMSAEDGETLSGCISGSSGGTTTNELISAIICSITCPSNNEHCKYYIRG